MSNGMSVRAKGVREVGQSVTPSAKRNKWCLNIPLEFSSIFCSNFVFPFMFD